MPRGDRTGPLGLGPRTGRSMGYCSGFRVPGFTNPDNRRSLWFGRNRRFGRLFWIAGLLPSCGYLAYRWAIRNRQQK